MVAACLVFLCITLPSLQAPLIHAEGVKSPKSSRNKPREYVNCESDPPFTSLGPHEILLLTSL